MDASILKSLGQIAGIGGLSLGVFFLLFRDVIRRRIFPRLTPDQGYALLRLIVVLVFIVAIFGLAIWAFASKTATHSISGTVYSGTARKQGYPVDGVSVAIQEEPSKTPATTSTDGHFLLADVSTSKPHLVLTLPNGMPMPAVPESQNHLYYLGRPPVTPQPLPSPSNISEAEIDGHPTLQVTYNITRGDDPITYSGLHVQLVIPPTIQVKNKPRVAGFPAFEDPHFDNRSPAWNLKVGQVESVTFAILIPTVRMGYPATVSPKDFSGTRSFNDALPPE